MTETKRNGWTCEHCDEEFESERALLNHWHRVGGDGHHDLTRDELRRVIDEHNQQWREHEVRVDIDVEIPRSSWAWAVWVAGIDADRGDLPDPNDMPDAALDLVDEHFHFTVVPDDESAV